MPLTAKYAALFLCVIIFLSTNQATQAQTISDELTIETIEPASLFNILDENKSPDNEVKLKKEAIIHRVEPGDTLTFIAEKYKISWEKIYDKNLSIKDPNILDMGINIVIPENNEKLKSREIPAQELFSPQIYRPSSQASYSEPKKPYTSARASISYSGQSTSSGNKYVAGYCTYYAKQRRPDLPNNLGNANTWAVRASAQGIATGSKPRPGSIGQQGMHVVYVEKVNKNGTVLVSEMNYKGLGIVSSRTVPSNYFTYIY